MNWDNVKAGAYGFGQAFLFMLWLLVARAILQGQNVYLSNLSYIIAGGIGAFGMYYYAETKYTQRLRRMA